MVNQVQSVPEVIVVPRACVCAGKAWKAVVLRPFISLAHTSPTTSALETCVFVCLCILLFPLLLAFAFEGVEAFEPLCFIAFCCCACTCAFMLCIVGASGRDRIGPLLFKHCEPAHGCRCCLVM